MFIYMFLRNIKGNIELGSNTLNENRDALVKYTTFSLTKITWGSFEKLMFQCSG